MIFQAEIAMREEGKPGMSDEEVCFFIFYSNFLSLFLVLLQLWDIHGNFWSSYFLQLFFVYEHFKLFYFSFVRLYPLVPTFQLWDNLHLLTWKLTNGLLIFLQFLLLYITFYQDTCKWSLAWYIKHGIFWSSYSLLCFHLNLSILISKERSELDCVYNSSRMALFMVHVFWFLLCLRKQNPASRDWHLSNAIFLFF